jgi:hypothetical protein
MLAPLLSPEQPSGNLAMLAAIGARRGGTLPMRIQSIDAV